MYRKKQEEFWRAFPEVTARGGGCGDIGQSLDISMNEGTAVASHSLEDISDARCMLEEARNQG